jgi:hypothetical protein
MMDTEPFAGKNLILKGDEMMCVVNNLTCYCQHWYGLMDILGDDEVSIAPLTKRPTHSVVFPP